MAKWKDVSSWSRSDSPEVRATPRTVQVDFGELVSPLQVVVTRHIHYDPTDWLVRIDNRSVPITGNKSLEEVKKIAVEMARKWLSAHISALADYEEPNGN